MIPELTTPIKIEIPGIGTIESADLYLKSEADKVIAELKAQKAQAEDDCAYWKMREGNAVNAMHETEEACMFLTKSERHQKYKRCLLRSVIAEMNATHFKDLFYGAGSGALADAYNEQITIHYKWNKLWLKLAEKFKDAK